MRNGETARNDGISRLSSLSDSTGTLESYDFLGLVIVVRRRHSQPSVDLTYVKQSGESNADAGDQYIGLDRFGCIADQRCQNTGNVVERFAYDPYGTPSYFDASWGTRSASSYAWIYLHQGGTWESLTGLYHFRNRDFSPSLERWLTPDQIHFAGGDHNLYRYVGNRLPNLTDPSGRIAVFFHGFGAGSSGGSSASSSNSVGSEPGSSSESSHGSAGSQSSDELAGYPLYKWTRHYRYDQVRKAVDDIIAVVKVTCEPIVVVGHSWGGDSAKKAAQRLADKRYSVNLLATLDPVTSTLTSLFGNTVEVDRPDGVKLAWNWHQNKDTPSGASMPRADENILNAEGRIMVNGAQTTGVLGHREIDDDIPIATRIERKSAEIHRAHKR